MDYDSIFWKVVRGEYPLPNAATLLGWKFIAYDKLKGQAHIEFNANASLTNPLGTIQGGMLSAMLDDCMGPAVYANLSDPLVAVTVELKTHFVKPASPGKINGCGWIVQKKDSTCITAGQLTDSDGNILATATAIYRIVRSR